MTGVFAAVMGSWLFGWRAAPLRPGHTPLAALAPLSSHERGGGCWFSGLGGVCWWCVYCPSPPRFALTSGSSPGQVLTLSRGGDHCITLAVDRQWFLVRDSYIPCERRSACSRPLRRAKGRAPFVLRTFPPQSGGNPTPLVAVLQWSYGGERGFCPCPAPVDSRAVRRCIRGDEGVV